MCMCVCGCVVFVCMRDPPTTIKKGGPRLATRLAKHEGGALDKQTQPSTWPHSDPVTISRPSHLLTVGRRLLVWWTVVSYHSISCLLHHYEIHALMHTHSCFLVEEAHLT